MFYGTQNKNGRPKGATNLATAKAKEAFLELLEANLERVQNDLDALKPNERIKLILEIASFVMPKMKATEVTSSFGDRINPVILQINENDL